MYIVEVRTHNDHKKEYKIIEQDLAYFYFSSFIQAVDVKYVVIIDGLTGEVLVEYDNGKIEIYT